ncbi:MAG: XRE family transcriptional regulator [Leeuwenhoekiella sp.]|nr:MAG: XRE family transcriptional regulator [Leeuwenhoekiella sp.]
MSKRKLQLAQLDRKIQALSGLGELSQPPTGWLKATRLALGMSLQQLAARLNITRQSVQEIEVREQEGSITLKSLKEAAQALDLELVYALIPKDGSLDRLVERKAEELALKIVSRTANTMELEDQQNSKERLKEALAERTAQLKREMPKTLWD